MNIAGNDVQMRLRAAFVGYVDTFDAGGDVKPLARYVLRAANTRRCVLEVFRFCLHQGHEFLHGIGRHIGANHQHIGHCDHQADWGEVFHGIKGQLDQMRGNRLPGVGGHQQGVAIGLRFGG